MLHRIVCSLSLLALSIAAAQAADDTVLTTPRLASIDNFRDIAGTTLTAGSTPYSTANDGTMRAGVFYRSNALTPSAADLATLDSLGIGAVYDLRTASEIAATPDTVPSGATYTNIDIIGSASSGANITSVSYTSAAQAVALMQETNRAFVNDAGMRSQFAVLFNDLASVDAAQLIHCTAGKDRTGIVTAILLRVLGVPQATVEADYLRSNDAVPAQIGRLHAASAGQAPNSTPAKSTGSPLASLPPDSVKAVMGVDPSYLVAAFTAIDTRYGSFDNYVTQGLKLTLPDVQNLRDRLLEPAR